MIAKLTLKYSGFQNKSEIQESIVNKLLPKKQKRLPKLTSRVLESFFRKKSTEVKHLYNMTRERLPKMEIEFQGFDQP